MTIEERRLPPALVAVGVALVALFVTLVFATIVAVAVDDTPVAPALDGLPLPEGVTVIDSMPVCTPSVCDGVGVAIIGGEGEGVAGRLATAWRSGGWASLPCRDGGAMCFGDEDLRISMNVWADVDAFTIAALADAVAAQGVDEQRLVYVHYYRCGSLYPCE